MNYESIAHVKLNTFTCLILYLFICKLLQRPSLVIQTIYKVAYYTIRISVKVNGEKESLNSNHN